MWFALGCGSDFVKGQLLDTGLRGNNPVKVSVFLEIPVKVPRILRYLDVNEFLREKYNHC